MSDGTKTAEITVSLCIPVNVRMSVKWTDGEVEIISAQVSEGIQPRQVTENLTKDDFREIELATTQKIGPNPDVEEGETA